ncbi:MAG: ABC transporter substrate-binding protein [Limnochordia bacterium]|jgi:iron complex transport system substrate-binding protein|nr:ABC transporter substrate-binding protein [Limnochordia bacterium]
MSKRNGLLIVIFTLVISCATLLAEAYPVTVIDSLGREVHLAKRPERIISLAPANTENLFRLGLADRIVGVTEWCNYPAEAAAKPKIGDFYSPNLELIIEQAPDLVVTAGGLQQTLQYINRLTELDIPVYVFEPGSIDEVIRGINNLGIMTDTTKTANEITAAMEGEIERVQKLVSGKSNQPEVFVVVGIFDGFITSVGPNTFIHEVIQTAGGTNAAADAKEEWPRYSLEVLIEKDPDVIISMTQYYPDGAESIFDLWGWEELTAVNTKRVHEVSNPDIISRGTYRIPSILTEIAQVLHPGTID